MRRIAVVLVVLGLVAAVGAQPLPTDQRLVSGELENGLRYIVRSHANPPGRAAMYLHVSTGSLNETDRQRGIAHYLEHMAFNGSENFPPGSVIPFFQSMGLSFGVHQNAFTSFDQTTYILELPDNKPETVDKGMLFFADIASRLALLPAEIENERQVILEERRTRLGGRQRVQDYVFERLAPGSTFGVRLPIGVEETITGVQQQDFRDYYGTWYVPGNMTLLVVADLDPAAVVERIKAGFSAPARAAVPADLPVGVTPDSADRAVVASDPEIATAVIQITRVGPARPPVTDEQGLRERMVDTVASWAFGRRLDQKVAEGKVSFQNGGASTGDAYRALRLAQVSAGGEPSRWRAMLTDIGAELQRARLHGFSAREIDDVKSEMLANVERAVQTEGTLPAQALLGAMNAAIADGEPITSAAQDLDLTRRILPTITPAEVSAAFARTYDTKNVAFILQLPAGGDVPTEEQLIALGRAALDVSPESEAEAQRPTELLASVPKAGRVAELGFHPASDVWNAWLDNGVRAHFRRMDYRKDTVMVTIALAGGALVETARDHGISQAAGVAWANPATTTLTSTNIRDLFTGKKIGVSGRSAVDAMVINISGSPEELEDGFRLAYLMLTDPVLERAAFDKWKEQQHQAIVNRALTVEGTFGELRDATIYPPGEVRRRPLTREEVDRLAPDAAEAWLRGQIAASPIEVTVVGDIERDRAVDLVRRYLGALPARPRIGKDTFASLRVVARPVGPLAAAKSMATTTDKALVYSGFFGPDSTNERDARPIAVAARVLSTRMIERIREKEQLVYSINVNASLSSVFPGYGSVEAYSYTAPAKVAPLLATIAEMYADFARSGPTEEEMDVARKQFANTFDEQMREPGYWAAALQFADYRDVQLGDIVETPGAIQRCTAADVREAFARYYTPAATVAISVTPRVAPPDAAETPATEGQTK